MRGTYGLEAMNAKIEEMKANLARIAEALPPQAPQAYLEDEPSSRLDDLDRRLRALERQVQIVDRQVAKLTQLLDPET
jgi:hypothetical protein